MMRKLYNGFIQILFTLLALYLTYLLLRYPVQALDYAYTGLMLWLEKMIPTLLPFMIISGIMIRLNLTERFARCFHPLFHTIWGTSLNGSYVLLMGMLCGFPMGARVIGELCHADKLSEEEGAFLLAFCNNIGPIYFISFVMSTLSLSGNYIPFFIMYGVPLIYGFLLYRLSRFRKHLLLYPVNAGQTVSEACPIRLSAAQMPLRAASCTMPQPSLLAAIDDSVLSGLIGIGKLGGYMVFFNLLNIILLPFSSLPEGFLSFCNCMLEITSGISRMGGSGRLLVLILLPFGGFSCISQTYSMIKLTNLSILQYILHKCIQMVITAAIYAAFCAFSCAYSF